MTYSLVAITSLSQAMTEILTFAAARGWTTSGSNLTNPVTGMVWGLSNPDGNSLKVQSAADSVRAALSLAPALNVEGVYTSLAPVTIHLFGNNAPYAAPDTSPYIAAVIEFPDRHFRHVYIGTMVKIGNYTDGDVIASNNAIVATSTTPYVDISQGSSWNLYQNLFGAVQRTAIASKPTGGVLITHADNPVPWRSFYQPGNLYLADNMTGNEVFGGNMDGVNDGFVHRGEADYGAGQLLVPVNLYVPDAPLGTDTRFRPIGMPSGVRLVSVKNLSPTQQYAVGGVNWRVFPELRKNVSARVDRVAGAVGYMPYESTQWLGLAYRE